LWEREEDEGEGTAPFSPREREEDEDGGITLFSPREKGWG